MASSINKVVILGGGSAGWMTAAMLSKTMGRQLNIQLIESNEMSTVGVGEATIPSILIFNRVLGLDEKQFLKATNGTIKLGIQFEHWNRFGDSYMHAFGHLGKDLGLTPFHHYWIKANKGGVGGSFGNYSLSNRAALRSRFNHVAKTEPANLSGLTYAYHFDAKLYADMLRDFSLKNGVERVVDHMIKVNQNSESGFVESLELRSGRVIDGDLFIDCSGFKGCLIEQCLETGYENWSQWLPCDRAIALPTREATLDQPFTRSIAHASGWQWRIPLQHRMGNGIVYCSSFMSDDAALETLTSSVKGQPIDDPRLIPFTTGRRKQQWHKNVVSLGLSSGFMEPLESTSLHMIQQGITRLIQFFPRENITDSLAKEYNRQSLNEFESIRDFLIMHYWLNQHSFSSLSKQCSQQKIFSSSLFWQVCKDMSVPDSLRERVELFKETGHIVRHNNELFSEIAWQQVLIGQGIVPNNYHPSVDALSARQLQEFLHHLQIIIESTTSNMMSHRDYIHTFCAMDDLPN